jgi:signal transduction histidine kinase
MHGATPPSKKGAENRMSTTRKWADPDAKAPVNIGRRSVTTRVKIQKDAYVRIIEHSADGILIADHDKLIRFVNPAAEVMLGKSTLALLGQPVEFPLSVGESTEISIARADLSAIAVADVRVVEIEWDGEQAYLALLRDVTERKRHEERQTRLLEREAAARKDAEQTCRMKDEFLAMLSHELRTPMTAIVGWMKLIRGDHVEPRQLRRGLDVIHRNVQTQLRLISDLLDISAIVTGKLQIISEQLDLKSLLASISESHRLTAEAHELSLTCAVDEDGVFMVKGDRDRLHQAMSNLLTNSIKFTPDGGVIHLALRRDGGCAEISVRDSGSGITPEFLPYVFERFRQADSSNARAHGGMGLGLAIARHIVELHGGTIGVMSPGVGQGSTFTIRLPIMI